VEIEQHAAGCRYENIVFVCFCLFVCSRLPAHCLFNVLMGTLNPTHSLTHLDGTALSDALEGTHFRIFVARWCHNFCKILVENCKESINWRKSLRELICIDIRDFNKILSQYFGPRT